MPNREKGSLLAQSPIHFGDEQTFNEVFGMFYGTLCDFSEKYLKNREDAEENVERLFTDLWNKKQVFTSEQHVTSYLYRAAFNGSLNVLRAKNRRSAKETAYGLHVNLSEEGFLNNMLRSEVVSMLHREIGKLPDQYASVLKLAYIEGLKNEEIAERCGYSLQTVKNYKVKGTQILKLKLSAEQWILVTSILFLKF